MDNSEVYSRIFRLETKLTDSIFKVWIALFLALYLFALVGLCLIHRAYTDSLREMRRELATVSPRAAPQAVPPYGRGP